MEISNDPTYTLNYTRVGKKKYTKKCYANYDVVGIICFLLNHIGPFIKGKNFMNHVQTIGLLSNIVSQWKAPIKLDLSTKKE